MSEFARSTQPMPDRSLMRPGRPVGVPETPRHARPERAGQSNQSVQRMLHAAIQAKLEVNAPDDAFEREADAAANVVMRAPDTSLVNSASATTAPPGIQRMSATAKDTLQRRPAQLDSLDDDKKRVRAEREEAERRARSHGAPHEIKDGHKKKDDDAGKVRTKRTSARVPIVTPETESRIERQRGGGASLDRATRQFFEERLGRDLGHVRVHSDSHAASAARELGAHAFTTDRDIYFASGRYEPATSQGKTLLAHELAHTVQQAPGPSVADTSRTPATASSHGQSVTRAPTSLSRAARTIARQPAPGAPAATKHDAEGEPSRDAAAAMALEEVALDKAGTFTPSPAVAEWISAHKGPTPVRVRLGKLARGTVNVSQRKGVFSASEQHLELNHPAFEPIKQAGLQPLLAVRIDKSIVTGHVVLTRTKGARTETSDVIQWLQQNAAAMGWLGFDDLQVFKPKNELANGELVVEMPELKFKLGGYFAGKGAFSIKNEAVTFAASAVIKLPHVTETAIEVERGADGALAGHVDVPIAIANFTGNLKAAFVGGAVSVEGMIGVRTEKMSGQVTLVMTDAKLARSVADPVLRPDDIRASKTEAEGKPHAGKKAKQGDRALAGFGEIDAHLTDWLTGRVQVVVDSEGHITVTGKFAPPAELVLFDQTSVSEPLFHLEIQTVYGVPLVGDAGFYAALGLDADARLGPGTLRNIVFEGQYSTDSTKPRNFSIEGTLNISAHAGLTLTAEGGVVVTIVRHDVKVGAAVHAGAGIDAYVEATPKIQYVETGDPEKGRKGEAHLQGHLEAAARPVLTLAGDLFVKLTTPWWSPISDHTWTWPLGELEYPVPSELGIGADIDYLIGSKQLPNFTLGKVAFDPSKFMTDLMGDQAPKKSTPPATTKGNWKGVEPKTDEPPPVGKSAAPKAATAPAKAAPPKAAAKGGKPGKAATSKQPAPGKSGEPVGPEHVLKPEIQTRWNQGLQAIGGMEEESLKDPMTRPQLDARLALIKRRFGFSDLSPQAFGADWHILAAMNPKRVVPGKVEGSRTEDKTEADSTRSKDEPLPTGKSQSTKDAIPMTWHKPIDEYPEEIAVSDGSRTKRKYRRNMRPTTDDLFPRGIGVAPEHWPKPNKLMHKEATERGTGVPNFRSALERRGYDWSGLDADHIQDLAFHGPDDPTNLWPLDAHINRSAGSRHAGAQRVDFLDDKGKPQNAAINDKRLRGRWFKIRDISL